ncbi:MAG: rod-binding protein [Lachnospiraceae bacterium]|nr:rod-binding protein [Lachnospiraceae bacterium]
MDIDTSFYNNYLNSIKENNLENSTADKLKNTLKSTDKNASDEELMEVCKEFEAYFVEQMFKAMEKTVPQSAMGYNSGDQLTDFFKDNVRQELSKKAADQSGLGLAQMLYEQMKRNNDETALG